MARSFSPAEGNRMVARLQASVEMEEEITLSPDEAWLVLKVIDRLLYNNGRRFLR